MAKRRPVGAVVSSPHSVRLATKLNKLFTEAGPNATQEIIKTMGRLDDEIRKQKQDKLQRR